MKKYLLLLAPLLIASCGTSSSDKKTTASTIQNIETSSTVQDITTFPKYGNYCGLNRPAMGENPKAIDEVDTACKNHDECYAKSGSFNIACDTMLIAELKNISPKTEPEKIARKSIISYFRNSPQKNLMEIKMDEIN